MSKVLRNQKTRKAYNKQQQNRRRITFSMLLVIAAIGFSVITFNNNTNIAVASSGPVQQEQVMLEGTDKSINEFVEPFINKQFSDGGLSSDKKIQDVVFFGNTNDYYKAVQIIFSIENNKAKIVSITVDGESVKNIEELYKLC